MNDNIGRQPKSPARSWLEDRLTALDAVYQRFGREGLKDRPIADVGLLLSSKELQLRDTAKGRDLGEEQKAANRQLELQIKDLTAFVKGQLAGLSLSDLRSSRQADRAQQHDPQRQFSSKGRDVERDR